MYDLFDLGLGLNSITHNGSGLCVRAGLNARMFNLVPKLQKSTNVQFSTSARLTQNPCWQFVVISVSSLRYFQARISSVLWQLC